MPKGYGNSSEQQPMIADNSQAIQKLSATTTSPTLTSAPSTDSSGSDHNWLYSEAKLCALVDDDDDDDSVENYDYANNNIRQQQAQKRIIATEAIATTKPSAKFKSLFCNNYKLTDTEEETKHDILAQEKKAEDFVVHQVKFDSQNPISYYAKQRAFCQSSGHLAPKELDSNYNNNNNSISDKVDDKAYESSKKPIGEQDCCFSTGESERCNCSGRHRATLAGLIDLFEQRVRVDSATNIQTTSSNDDNNNTIGSPSWLFVSSQLIKGKNHKKTSSVTEVEVEVEEEEEEKKKQRQEQQRVQNHKSHHHHHISRLKCSRLKQGANINKRQQITTNSMRNIITPVNYNKTAPTTTEEELSTEEEQHDNISAEEPLDSLDCEQPQRWQQPSLPSGAAVTTSSDSIENDDWRQRRFHHHVSIKGVPVLPKAVANHRMVVRGASTPSSFHRKLTKLNWQPPTDGRQYETKDYSRFSPNNNHISNKSSHSARSWPDSQSIELGQSQEQNQATNQLSSTQLIQQEPQEVKKIIGQEKKENCPICYQDCFNQQQKEKQTVASKITTSENNDQVFIDNCRCTKTRPLTSASFAATRGPPIVKHQASSSRRLLKQLARLRRLNEPKYKVRRPEKVAQVEALIEELERATAKWEEDELLLDRAERRDWPIQYYERYLASTSDSNYGNHTQTADKVNLSEHKNDLHQIESNFVNRRLDVDQLEEKEIAKSHSTIYAPTIGGAGNNYSTNQLNMMAPWSASSSLGRSFKSTTNQRQVSSAFADRYNDDLAIRRLNCENRQQRATDNNDRHQSNKTQMSYLLCTDAYGNLSDPNESTQRLVRRATSHNVHLDSLDRHLRSDDLHYRSVKNKLDPHEPPFGIPRQVASASTHSSASHYLRRRQYDNDKQQNNYSPLPTPTIPNRVSQSSMHPLATGGLVYSSSTSPQHQKETSRSESKVSFATTDEVNTLRRQTGGGVSADSGLVVAESPTTTGGRQSASSRLTATSPIRPLTPSSISGRSRSAGEADRHHHGYELELEDDAAEEIDLDEELARGEREGAGTTCDRWSQGDACESPARERYTAEYMCTPTRRRPKIKIENPRAKSPLLRTNSRPLIIQATNDKVAEKTNSVTVQVQCYTDSLGRRKKSVGELECSYDFPDEEEDDFSDNVARRKLITTNNFDTSDSSTNQISDSIINDYIQTSKSNEDSFKSMKSPIRSYKSKQQDAPLFSIGSYKSLNKSDLKIL